MVFTTQVNNSACTNLGPPAYNACVTTAGVCTGLSGDLTLALTPIIYTLFAIGGIKVLDGIVKIADLGVDTVGYFVDQAAKKRFLRERVADEGDDLDPLIANDQPGSQEVKPPPSRWKLFVGGWDRLSSTGKTIGAAALCLFIAYPMLKIIGAVNSGCASVQGECPHFKAEVIEGCDWVDQFVIELIKQLIQDLRQ